MVNARLAEARVYTLVEVEGEVLTPFGMFFPSRGNAPATTCKRGVRAGDHVFPRNPDGPTYLYVQVVRGGVVGLYTVKPRRRSAVGRRMVTGALDHSRDPLFVAVVRPEPNIGSRWEVIRRDACFRAVASMLGTSSTRRATLHLDRWRATLLLAVRRPHELRPAAGQGYSSWEKGCGPSVFLGRDLLTLDHLTVGQW